MASIPLMELKDGNKIPKMGLGTYRLKERKGQAAIKIALNEGYNHIDTAEMYGNESMIGEVISNMVRSDLFITSKVWPTNLHYNDVLDACQDSLDKLETSYLDLYLIHWPNDSVPIEETVEAMEKLHDENMIKSVGVSNFTKAQLKEAMKVSDIPIVVNQVEFHPWLYQKDLLNFCKNNEITLIAYAPLARTKCFEEPPVQDLSEKYDKSPAQIVLRWEIQKNVIPIPKSSSEDHIRENMKLFDWELDYQDIEKIDSISKKERLINQSYSSF